MPRLPIPAGFGQSKNITKDAKQVIVSQALAFGASKGKFTKLMKSVNGTRIITAHHEDGSTSEVEVFGKPNIGPAMGDPESEAVEMLELMIGLDEEGRQHIYDVYAQDAVENLILDWKTRQGYEVHDWERGLDLLSAQVFHIDTVELAGYNISYGFDYTDNATLRVPKRIDRFGDIQKTLNEAGMDEEGFNYPFSPPDTNIIVDIKPEYIMGSTVQGALEVTFKDSSGNNITNTVQDITRKAVASLIIANNGKFMEHISTSKLSEKLVTISTGASPKQYYEIQSKDVYKCTILNGFSSESNHLNNTFEHPDPEDGLTRYVPKVHDENDSRYLQYVEYYLADFWIFRDATWTDHHIEKLTDGLFVYNKPIPGVNGVVYSNGTVHLVVDKFNRVSQNDYFKYVTNLIALEVKTKDSSGCCGIGGFIGDLLGSFVGFIGAVVGVATDLVLVILEITGAYSLLIAVGFSEENIELIARVIATIILAYLTLGVSEYIQIASAAAQVGTAASAAVAAELSVSLVVGLATEAIIVNLSTNTVLTVVQFAGKLAPLAGMNIGQTEVGESSVEEQEEAEQNTYNKRAGSAGDKDTILRELNYNPFARQELARLQRYPSMQEKPNPLDNLMT